MVGLNGQHSNGHQVGDLLLMSLWRGCTLLCNKTMDLDGVMRRLWSIPTTWRAEASCRDLWAKICMLARVLVGDDSWSS